MTVVAGIDSSTQSTKVVLCDADSGKVLGSGSAPHVVMEPPCSEQQPEDWWQAFLKAWQQAIGAAGVAASDVRALSFASQCHGLVVMDAADRVIRPAKLWNDTTSAPEMATLLERLDAAQWAQRIGSVPTAAFTISKLAWVNHHEPAHFARIAHILLPAGWLTWRVTGNFTSDRSAASGTGFYDADRGRHDIGLLELIDADKDWAPCLPRVLGPQEPAGTVLPDVARELGVLRDTLVGPGAGDQHASALGLGMQAGDRVLSLGTSGVVYAYSASAIHDESGSVDGVADATGGFLPLVCTLNAARVTDTFARLLGVSHDAFDDLALAAEASGTPVLAAYLDGERAPNLPYATGTLAGLHTNVTRAQLARAAIDGVLFGLKRASLRMDALGVPFTGRLLLTGGAARSRAYRQLAADAFDRSVSLTDSVESVAVGAAMQAAAVRRGMAVTQVRDAWAIGSHVAAHSVDPGASAVLYERYLKAADWRGSDFRAPG